MNNILKLSPQYLLSQLTFEQAKENDLEWVKKDKLNRTCYGTILGNNEVTYDDNFKIFGYTKLTTDLIRSASNSKFYNTFEYKLSLLALKESAKHPSLSNCLFYFPRLVTGLNNAIFIIERKSKFHLVYMGDDEYGILISVRIKILNRFHSGMLFPHYGTFKSSTGQVINSATQNVNRDAFEYSLKNLFPLSLYRIIDKLRQGWSKNEIINDEFKKSINSPSYDAYTKEIRRKLKEFNDDVKVDMDYFINFCNFYA